MQASRQPHWEAISRILRYLKGAHGKDLLCKHHHRSSQWRASVMLVGHVVAVIGGLLMAIVFLFVVIL